LGDVLKRQRQYQPALEAFRRAIDLNPSIVQLHLNMAFTHLELRQFTEALHAAQKAVELDPQSVDGWFAMGNAHCFLHQTGASMAAFERVLALNPQYPEALINLGNAYSDQGRISEALDCYRRANEVDSTCLPAVENILSTLHYSPECGLAEIYRAHVAWDEKFARQFREQWQPFDNDRSPERPLRIGLYSNNLGNHPVGYFVRAAFEALDRSQFSLVVYSGRVTDDAECDHFKETASEWCEVAALSDAELATKIRQDHIDILIDLAGRSAGGRPFLLARKPAPLLINWIGYTGTLGLSSVDYILTDRHHIPEGAEEYYVEEVLRLDDGHICFEGPATAPDVSPLPAASRGYVTFGSFNNPGKVNSEVVDVWAEILRHVPESRLVLKYRNFADSSTRGHFEELFAQRGIEAGRLTFEGVTPYSEMLRRYHDIDIALDPFPFTGGMTTCLALWMGCPVITWPRDTFASRQSLSYLLTIGLPELVAAGRTEYVGKAVGLASDLGALANLRRRIRPTMSASPFCDRVRFVRNLERVLRGVWRKWCKDSEA
jgi:predicted O-linked N-acetylglucosamine transferase (SPINDLY family)